MPTLLLHQRLRNAGVVAAALLLSAAAHSQTFYKSYSPGFTTTPGMYMLVGTSDGGYLMSGGYGGTERIVKSDANGNIQWTRQPNDGYGYMKSTQSSTGSYFINYAVNNQIAVMKLKPDGSHVWSRNYFQSNNAYLTPSAFCATNDAGFMFAGGNCGVANYIVRCDSTGAVIWSKQFRNPYSGIVHTIFSMIPSHTPGNYVALCNDPATTTPDIKYAVLEIDGNGTVIWYKNYAPSTGNYGPVSIAKNGKGYVMCALKSPQAQVETTYLTRIDAAGTPLWTKSFSRTNKLQMQTMASNASGNIVVAGSEIVAGTASDAQLKAIYFMVDSTGALKWSKHYGVFAFNRWGGGIEQAISRGDFFYLGGGAYSEYLSVGRVANNGSGYCSSEDITVTVANATVTVASPAITTPAFTVNAPIIAGGVTTVSYKDTVYCRTTVPTVPNAVSGNGPEAAFRVSPNPANDVIHITATTGWRSMQLRDITGRIVASQINEASGITAQLNVAQLPEGFYYLALVDDNGLKTETKKILIRH